MIEALRFMSVVAVMTVCASAFILGIGSFVFWALPDWFLVRYVLAFTLTVSLLVGIWEEGR